MLKEIKEAAKVYIGSKQTAKAVAGGGASLVFIARDAEAKVVGGILDECRKKGIPVQYVDTMRELGRSCGIDVGAAAVAVVAADQD